MNDERDRQHRIVGARHAVPLQDNSQRRHRRSIRLLGYDYSQAGAYFVTVCAHDRMCLFGEIADGKMRLNEAGRIVQQCWNQIPEHFPHVELGEFIVMPNHVHGIVVIAETPNVGARHAVPLPEKFCKPVPGSIPTIVRSFKSAVTKRINEMRGTPGVPVWQRNYYEHVIRNDESLHCIREYIINNPLQWDMDRENMIFGAGLKPAPTGNEPWRI